MSIAQHRTQVLKPKSRRYWAKLPKYALVHRGRFVGTASAISYQDAVRLYNFDPWRMCRCSTNGMEYPEVRLQIAQIEKGQRF